MGLATTSQTRQSLVLGRIAMDLIRTHRTGAHPRQYETWYSCVSGQSPALHQELRRRLLAGAVTTQDLDQLYGDYLAPKLPGLGADAVGVALLDQVDRFGAALHAAGAETGVLEKALSATLGGLDGGEAKSGIEEACGIEEAVDQALQAAGRAWRSNGELRARLQGFEQELASFGEQLLRARRESALDPLTGLCNRASLEKRLDKTLCEARQSGLSLCLIMADIDHFKQFNDRFGHLVGDQVIRLVGTVITQTIGRDDFAGRFGGEEFVIVLPGTPIAEALAVAERIRVCLGAKELVRRSTRETIAHVTISAGIAVFRRDEDATALIGRADRLLYDAKNAGRNCVACEDAAMPWHEIATRGACDA